MSDEFEYLNSSINSELTALLAARHPNHATKIKTLFCNNCGNSISTERFQLGKNICRACESINELERLDAAAMAE